MYLCGITNPLILSDMIKYVIQAMKNPLKKEEVKSYPQAAPTTQVTQVSKLKNLILQLFDNQYLVSGNNCLIR
ncbi:hypothetical protein HMPREF2139_06750 [Prevotella denticola DNF00960]|nr:hypothetical protein HMPREF2139_06750 [Prevotella denticola DNF00960]